MRTGSTGSPVFVDPTGRRRAVVRRACWALGAVCVAYLGLVLASLLGPPGLARLTVPGLGPLLPGQGVPGLSTGAGAAHRRRAAEVLSQLSPQLTRPPPSAGGATAAGGGSGLSEIGPAGTGSGGAGPGGGSAGAGVVRAGATSVPAVARPSSTAGPGQSSHGGVGTTPPRSSPTSTPTPAPRPSSSAPGQATPHPTPTSVRGSARSPHPRHTA